MMTTTMQRITYTHGFLDARESSWKCSCDNTDRALSDMIQHIFSADSTKWHSISEVVPKQKHGSQIENNFLLYKCPYSSCKQIMHDTKGIEQHLLRAMKSTNSLTKEAHTVKDVYTPQFYVLHCNSKVIDDTWLKYHTNTANLPPTRFTPMNTRVPDVIIDDTCIKQDCTMKPETLRILTDTQFTEKITYSLNEIANQPTTEFFKRKLKFIMNQCNNELSLNTLRRILQSFRSCHFFKNKKKKNKPRHDKKPGLSCLDLDRAVQLVQYNKNISKTYNFLTRKLDCPKQLSEEEITDQMDKLFPQPQYVKIPNCVAPQGISNPHFKPEEINRAIMSLKSSKESGPDGINHVLLKRAAASNPKILDLLSNCYEHLLTYPQDIIQVPELFEFTTTFIPKGDDGIRPLSQVNSFLQVFHSLLLQHLTPMIDLDPHQYAMQKQSMVKCVIKTRKMHETKHLLKLDIQAAFSSINWEYLEYALKLAAVPLNIIQYIMSMLELRYSRATGQLKCGSGQGDCLSSLLFSLYINTVVQKLSETYDVIAYCDDILLGLDADQSDELALNTADAEFRNIGLTLKQAKCQSTRKGHKINFMGVEFEPQLGASKAIIDTSISEKAKKVMENLKRLHQNKVNSHVILKFIQYILVPKANWGAFIDLNDSKSKYEILDQQIAEYVKELFGVECTTQRIYEFLYNPHDAQGLQLLMPGQAFDTQQLVMSCPNDVDQGFEQYHNKRKEFIDNATKKFEANLTIQANRAQEYSNDSRKPKPELINIAHMSLLSSRILTNEQFDLTCQSIFTPEKFFKQNEEGIHIFCPCCRTDVVMQNHHMYCKGMNGLTKQIHNAQVSNIINIIDKKHNPMVCKTARQVNDDEQSKLQPDIVTKDNQTFDFSVSKNPLAICTKQKSRNMARSLTTKTLYQQQQHHGCKWIHVQLLK
ncbi:Reverse_transcriptase/endonuclease [Hexamita inflata]|uniref:Putative n=1 Tax=Hexamita inflata TaxID=28002 RepID=A0AA86N425_9EUKA|nr:Reverse transcriptase/endonuclease [Hexamita inflata]